MSDMPERIWLHAVAAREYRETLSRLRPDTQGGE
jgi:hypothetical protein